MERPLPFQPRPTRSPSGWTLSLGLHGALLLLALWYATTRPMLAPMPPMLPVDLVVEVPAPPSPSPGPRTASNAPRPTAPQRTAVPPQESAEPVDDALTARLESLSRLRAPDGPLRLSNGGGNGTGSGGMSLEDFVRSQIMRRWFPVLTNRQRRDQQPVLLRITVSERGEITDITILDRQEFDGNLLFRSMAISARNAALLSSPVQMPPGNWPRNTVMTITLNPRDASR